MDFECFLSPGCEEACLLVPGATFLASAALLHLHCSGHTSFVASFFHLVSLTCRVLGLGYLAGGYHLVLVVASYGAGKFLALCKSTLPFKLESQSLTHCTYAMDIAASLL